MVKEKLNKPKEDEEDLIESNKWSSLLGPKDKDELNAIFYLNNGNIIC